MDAWRRRRTFLRHASPFLVFSPLLVIFLVLGAFRVIGLDIKGKKENNRGDFACYVLLVVLSRLKQNFLLLPEPLTPS